MSRDVALLIGLAFKGASEGLGADASDVGRAGVPGIVADAPPARVRSVRAIFRTYPARKAAWRPGWRGTNAPATPRELRALRWP
jgi:hypothetical protein